MVIYRHSEIFYTILCNFLKLESTTYVEKHASRSVNEDGLKDNVSWNVSTTFLYLHADIFRVLPIWLSFSFDALISDTSSQYSEYFLPPVSLKTTLPSFVFAPTFCSLLNVSFH